MPYPRVKVVQSACHSNANLESLFPRQGVVVSVIEVVAEVSITDELVDWDHLRFIDTISDEMDDVRVAKQQHLGTKPVETLS